MSRAAFYILALALLVLGLAGPCPAAESEQFQSSIFRTAAQKPVDSHLKVAVGEAMPDFSLPTIDHGRVSLADFRGRNLVLSFIPAAWTPVCSGQWPGYNITREIFQSLDTALLGVSLDNTPSQFAWVSQMGGLWFPVASDFWPHGELAQKLGILRPEGVSERALFLVDAFGIIRYINVNDINSRPDLGELIMAIQALR